MPNITDVQVVKFSNERARTLADAMTALYAKLVAYQADWSAQSMSAKITAAGASNNVGDGADMDGRTIITGISLVNFKAAIDALKTAYDTNVTGVGAPVTTIQNGIQVNGSPR